MLACVDNVVGKAEDLYEAGIHMYPDKKNFAVKYVQRLSDHPGFAPILYQLHRSGGLGARDIVLEFLRKEGGRWILS